ncbi:MAG: Hsp20/alpha crystallin family protein [Candidatus Xiphinematobacter sp.]|nr:MAG: Hsp20/alpha crystallin family protein [Candidatus Xiphinematobacter sp.]QQY10762.1 MAG: Hsp20/alpha crystallin family protein [Candidatus Xiphinematobacter sp.]
MSRLQRLRDYEVFPWEAFHQASSLRDFFNHALEWIAEPSFLRTPWSRHFLTMDEEEDRIVVKLELVGMGREDFEIELKDSLLTVSGQRKAADQQAKEGEPLRRERFFGKFSRSISLPTGVNESAVTASYKDGILAIVLPKSEKAKPRRVTIHAS